MFACGRSAVAILSVVCVSCASDRDADRDQRFKPYVVKEPGREPAIVRDPDRSSVSAFPRDAERDYENTNASTHSDVHAMPPRHIFTPKARALTSTPPAAEPASDGDTYRSVMLPTTRPAESQPLTQPAATTPAF